MSTAIETNGTPDLAAECKKWEKQCAELILERDRLRAELAKTASERDSYLKTVYYYLRQEDPAPNFTKEEALAALANEQSFGDMISEIKKEFSQENKTCRSK